MPLFEWDNNIKELLRQDAVRIKTDLLNMVANTSQELVPQNGLRIGLLIFSLSTSSGPFIAFSQDDVERSIGISVPGNGGGLEWNLWEDGPVVTQRFVAWTGSYGVNCYVVEVLRVQAGGKRLEAI